jgi:hypothetical protein
MLNQDLILMRFLNDCENKDCQIIALPFFAVYSKAVTWPAMNFNLSWPFMNEWSIKGRKYGHKNVKGPGTKLKDQL